MEGRRSRGRGDFHGLRGPRGGSYVHGTLSGHGASITGHDRDLQHGLEANIENSGRAEQENVWGRNRQPVGQLGLRDLKGDRKPVSFVKMKGSPASIGTSDAPNRARFSPGRRLEDESESRVGRPTSEVFGNVTSDVAQQDREAPNIYTPILPSHTLELVPVTTVPVMMSNNARRDDISEAIKVLETGVNHLTTTLAGLQKIQRRLALTAASAISAPETAPAPNGITSDLCQNLIDEDNPPLRATVLNPDVDLSRPTPSKPSRHVPDPSARQIAELVKKDHNSTTRVEGLGDSVWAFNQGHQDSALKPNVTKSAQKGRTNSASTNPSNVKGSRGTSGQRQKSREDKFQKRDRTQAPEDQFPNVNRGDLGWGRSSGIQPASNESQNVRAQVDKKQEGNAIGEEWPLTEGIGDEIEKGNTGGQWDKSLGTEW